MNYKKLALSSLIGLAGIPVSAMRLGKKLIGAGVSAASLAAVGYPVYKSVEERVPRLTDPETIWGKDLHPTSRALVDTELRRAGIDPKTIRLKYHYDVHNPGKPGSIEAVGNHALVIAPDNKDLPHYPQAQMDHALKASLRQNSWLHTMKKAVRNGVGFSSDWQPAGEYAHLKTDNPQEAHALTRFLVQRAIGQLQNNHYALETALEIAVPCALYVVAKIIKQPFPQFSSFSTRQWGKVGSTAIQLGAAHVALQGARGSLNEQADETVCNDAAILKAGARSLRYQACAQLESPQKELSLDAALSQGLLPEWTHDALSAYRSIKTGITSPITTHSMIKRAQRLEDRAEKLLHTPPL